MRLGDDWTSEIGASAAQQNTTAHNQRQRTVGEANRAAATTSDRGLGTCVASPVQVAPKWAYGQMGRNNERAKCPPLTLGTLQHEHNS